MEWIADPQIWASLVTLTVMEIVLGIDNIVFISVLVSRLPQAQADSARKIGLSLALVFRILLLLVISWIIGLTQPLFSLFGEAFSWRDIILLAGGAFLLVKGTLEIHAGIEGEEGEHGAKKAPPGFWSVIVQILLIDLVFSVDSIITAVGMAQHVEVMIAAVVISIGIMFIASGPVATFIKQHPTTKMLALSFLLLIGMALIADGLGFHIPRAYIYFAMAFSALVEVLNILRRRKRLTAGAGDEQ
ncbi:TerC family protein [Amorphus orientalis]|uniref:Tellurium resistance membrane protein TerC n=1 Tax=Amorphus orientalis TaxID=649198 RepID=A0AAE4AS72_9HYPH|nr:TerC family protein [Amorphus orientalis]MDQ0315926.1 putative tellurium resistance membrane protein TerC [Amorphus orientalis]